MSIFAYLLCDVSFTHICDMTFITKQLFFTNYLLAYSMPFWYICIHDICCELFYLLIM